MILNRIKFLFRAFVSERDSDPTEWHIWYECLFDANNLPPDEAVKNDIDIFDLRDYMDDLDPDKCYQVYGSGTLVYTYCDATQEYDVELIINQDCVKTEWIPVDLHNELNEIVDDDDQKELWSISTDEETFHGRFDSKKDAINQGHVDGHYPFWVGRCSELPSPETYWNAEDWLEHVSVQDDYSHETAEDWDRSTRLQLQELEAEVRAVMASWLDRYQLRPRCFTIDPDTTEKIDH